MKRILIVLTLIGCGGTEEPCGSGRPTYGNICQQDGLPMRWPSFPVKVVAVDEIDLDISTWIVASVQSQNDELGLEVFTLNECIDCPQVVVREASKLKSFRLKEKIPENIPSVGTPILLAGTCYFSRGEIDLLRPFRKLSDEQKISVLKYELSHVLGLRHEPYWSGYDNLECPMPDAHRVVVEEQVRLAEEGS